MNNNWKDMIPGCFGDADGIFAGHGADIKRAREMLREAFNQKVNSWKDFEKPIEDYLKKKNWGNAYINKQLKRIKSLDNYFPND